MLLVSKIAGSLLVREENRDVIARKARCPCILDDAHRLSLGACNTKNCLVCHGCLPTYRSRSVRDFELIVDLVDSVDLLGLLGHHRLLFSTGDGPTQGDYAAVCD